MSMSRRGLSWDTSLTTLECELEEEEKNSLYRISFCIFYTWRVFWVDSAAVALPWSSLLLLFVPECELHAEPHLRASSRVSHNLLRLIGRVSDFVFMSVCSAAVIPQKVVKSVGVTSSWARSCEESWCESVLGRKGFDKVFRQTFGKVKILICVWLLGWMKPDRICKPLLYLSFRLGLWTKFLFLTALHMHEQMH